MKYDKYLAGVAMCALAAGSAEAAGLWQTLPIVGGAAYCASGNVVGPAQATITGQGGAVPAANTTTGNVICGNNVPAGEPALTGSEVLPLDLYTPGTQVFAGGPSTEVLPVTLLGAGYGAIAFGSTTGTGQSITIGNGVSNFIYDGSSTASITFTLPSLPFQNEHVCINNGASNILTLTAVNANTSAITGQSIFAGAVVPTALEVPLASSATSSGITAVCYVYNVSNTTWYRL